MITIHKLNKTFTNNGSEKTIFSDFNIVFEKGQKIGLFGPNGSGKTTLLNLLSGVDKKYGGKVEVKRKRVSYVHQDYNSTLLPWFSCERNILLAREYHGLNKSGGLKRLKQLIKELKINFSLKQYPFSLSGGQKQIVTLMRALVLEPEILLLDEPFASLDVERRFDILAVLKKYFTKDMTVIICSHRGDEISSILDRAVVLQHQPVKITKDILAENMSRKNFEDTVLKIRFQKNDEI